MLVARSAWFRSDSLRFPVSVHQVFKAYRLRILGLVLSPALAIAGFAQDYGCAPSAPGVRICSPDPSSNLGSVVTIIAGASAQSGNITAIRTYLDDNPVFTADNPNPEPNFQAAADVNADEGVHHLVVVGYQDDGGAVVSDLYFLAVVASYASCIPTTPGAMFCHPSPGIIMSPVQISVGATAQSGYLKSLSLYVDGVAQATVSNPQQSQSFAINQPLAIEHTDSFAHTIMLVGYDSNGGAVTAAQSVQYTSFNPPQLCPALGTPGVHVCAPAAQNYCTTNGVYTIRATGTSASGTVDHMELWADGNKLADFPGNLINTNIGQPLLGGGPIHLAVVEVDSNGEYIASDPITVSAC